jgi:cytochrome c5
MKYKPLVAAIVLGGLLGACSGGSGSNPGVGAPSTGASSDAAAPPVPGAPPPQVAAGPAPATADTGGGHGKSVFDKTCALCHAAGVAGAPMPGNKEEWAPRVAQGRETLYTHALEGFTGQKGMMPARGGNAALTDEDVKAAVDYMVNKSS